MPVPESTRQQLRRAMRQRRRALPQRAQQRAAQALALRLPRTWFWRDVERLTGFAAADGEPDLWPLMQAAHKSGREVYLPVITAPDAPLVFRRWRPNQQLIANRLGILEPADGATLPPRAFDLVLTPLVAFDDHGNRLGMGGGFYDRGFAFLRQPYATQRPWLVGIAHAFQQVPALPVEPWDVPLWGILTPAGIQRFPLHGPQARHENHPTQPQESGS